MRGLTASIVALLVAILLSPAIVQAAQAAVPLLLSALVLLGVLRLAWPPRRRR
ncbi:MAG TPA: hypothetical protein VF545_03040 [Thermoleophilaceae bacterium]